MPCNLNLLSQCEQQLFTYIILLFSTRPAEEMWLKEITCGQLFDNDQVKLLKNFNDNKVCYGRQSSLYLATQFSFFFQPSDQRKGSFIER